MFYNTKIAKQEQDDFANILITAHWLVTERTSSLLSFLIIKKYVTELGNQKKKKKQKLKTKQKTIYKCLLRKGKNSTWLWLAVSKNKAPLKTGRPAQTSPSLEV